MTHVLTSIAVGEIRDVTDDSKVLTWDFTTNMVADDVVTLVLPAGTNSLTFPATTGTLVEEAFAQALTNKTIDGSLNTITNIDLTTAVTGTLPAANGGVGIAAYTVGDILYASGATALSKLAGVATGNALISGGVATAPSWGKIGLTTHVSGVLPVANGGTNSSTALNDDRIMVSSGGAIVEAAALTNGQLLIGSTGAAPVAATVTGAGGINVNVGAGTLEIEYAGVGARESFSLAANPISITSTTGTDVLFVPWSDAKYGSVTTRTIMFYMVYGGARTLSLEILDQANVTLAGPTVFNTTGLQSITFTDPGANGHVKLRMFRSAGAGASPLIQGITMDFV